MNKFFIILFFSFGLLISADFVLASTTDGTVSGYAWSENLGWLNFGNTNGNIHVTDSVLTGYAWNEYAGWIHLAPSQSGVTNNNEGTLSGYAWGESTGWIDFSLVVINSSGVFTGTASGDITGTINFNCSNCNVQTDWRPASSRTVAPTTTGGGPAFMPVATTAQKIIEIAQKLIEELQKIPELIARIPEIFIPKPPGIKPTEIPVEQLVSKQAPFALSGKWKLLITYTLADKPLLRFSWAPLPKEFTNLAQKIPELGKTLKEVGVVRLLDIEKLKTAKLTLPSLSKTAGLPSAEIEPGKLALPKGVPLAKIPQQVKKALPTEIVFAKTGAELIDFNIVLAVTEKGKPEQRINTISGKPLQLAIKVDKPVKAVKGYVVFKTRKSKPSSFQIPLNKLLASLMFASPTLATSQEKPVEVEEKLVLQEFEYQDPDGDGIYTAEIQSPLVEGEYEIITVLDFEDPELGKKEIRLITVVDPEGYIFEKDGNKETRIPGAIVSIFWLNSATKQYELWPAKEYQQENPQITNATGKYAFLVPEGSYYLKVEAPGYLLYDGKPFQVSEGSGVHFNIELKTRYWFFKVVDWKTFLLILIIILLVYNFYRDTIREKLINRR